MSKKHRKTEKKEITKATGYISITGKGVGYFSFPGISQDIEIPEASLKTAMHGDEVEVLLHPVRRGSRRTGEVIRVFKRAKTRFVGVIKKENGMWLLMPDDRRAYRDIVITEEYENLRDGVKALAEMTLWEHRKSNPHGKVISIIGAPGEHNVEMESIVLEKGFDLTFPKEVEKEAARIKETMFSLSPKEESARRDVRGVPTFTIDPVDAKDFDDALSFQKIGDNLYEVGIHIADVSHYVSEGSALDKEARNRGLSVYLVDRTIPMLPPVLSNDLCSLNPNENKASFSVIVEITGKGVVKKRWFGRTLMRSNRRFNYEEAQEVIDDGGEYEHELRKLNSIAKRLTAKRYASGSIDFETTEVKFVLDEKGVPLSVTRKKRLDTHRLIEEFMLLANREVAEFTYQAQKQQGYKIGSFIYRIHDIPDRDKIESLSVFVKALGYSLPVTHGKVSAQDLNALLKKIEGKAGESLIRTAAVRSMAKAVYSTKNIGHFGLAFQYYTHFTSPIRRYPDLLVHRLLGKYLVDKTMPLNEFSKYEKIASDTSDKERLAAEAERDSVKYKQVEYMSKFIGKTFKGIVSGVTEWGMYIEEIDTKSEGMVKLRDMADDYYTLDEKTYSLIGKRLGRKFSLGDEVVFRITGSDIEKKTLDYVLV